MLHLEIRLLCLMIRQNYVTPRAEFGGWCILPCGGFRGLFSFYTGRVTISKFFAYSGMSTCHVSDEYQALLRLSGGSAYLCFGCYVFVGYSMETFVDGFFNVNFLIHFSKR